MAVLLFLALISTGSGDSNARQLLALTGSVGGVGLRGQVCNTVHSGRTHRPAVLKDLFPPERQCDCLQKFTACFNVRVLHINPNRLLWSHTHIYGRSSTQ